MKHVKTLNVLLMAGLLSVTACNNANSGATSTTDSAMSKVDTAAKDIKQDAQSAVNDAKGAMSSNADSNFVVKAAITNMAELKVLQAGLDNGTSKELKAHAKMMIADHKKLGDKVKAYSASKNYTLPADDGGKGDDAIAKLGNNKGADWDKAWVNHMVSAHEDCISMFEKGQNDVKDADLKTIIAGALPTLHSHLDMMKQMQDKMGK
jgi:putative membrane protein